MSAGRARSIWCAAPGPTSRRCWRRSSQRGRRCWSSKSTTAAGRRLLPDRRPRRRAGVLRHVRGRSVTPGSRDRAAGGPLGGTGRRRTVRRADAGVGGARSTAAAARAGTSGSAMPRPARPGRSRRIRCSRCRCETTSIWSCWPNGCPRTLSTGLTRPRPRHASSVQLSADGLSRQFEMCERDRLPGGVCCDAARSAAAAPPEVELTRPHRPSSAPARRRTPADPTQLSYRICGSHFG